MSEIIINGKKHIWSPSIITMKEVGELAFKETEWFKKNPLRSSKIISEMSATYKNAHPDLKKSEGIMSYGHAVRITDGTIFNIAQTGNA